MFQNLLPVTKNLILINVIFFVGTYLWEPQIRFDNYPDIDSFLDLGRNSLATFPPNSKYFYPIQVVSGLFMHGDPLHLLFNMLGLFFFGSMVEGAMGPKRFFTFYILCGLGGLGIYWAADFFMWDGIIRNVDFLYHGWDLRYPVLGASGAIYGVLLALAYIAPDMRVQLLFPPIPIKIGYLALGLVAFDVYRGWSGTGGSTAVFAHVGGALLGVGLTALWSNSRGGLYKS